MGHAWCMPLHQVEYMPLRCPETCIDAGDSVKNHAPESSKKPAPKRGISDFALRSLKATDRPHMFTLPAHRVGWLWKFQVSEVDDWVRVGGADEEKEHE